MGPRLNPGDFRSTGLLRIILPAQPIIYIKQARFANQFPSIIGTFGLHRYPISQHGALRPPPPSPPDAPQTAKECNPHVLTTTVVVPKDDPRTALPSSAARTTARPNRAQPRPSLPHRLCPHGANVTTISERHGWTGLPRPCFTPQEKGSRPPPGWDQHTCRKDCNDRILQAPPAWRTQENEKKPPRHLTTGLLDGIVWDGENDSAGINNSQRPNWKHQEIT